MILWAFSPLLLESSIDSLTIATSFLIFLIGVTYPLIIFKPDFRKLVAVVEGLIFIAVGLIFQVFPLNILYVGLGIVLFVFGIFSYIKIYKKS